MSANNHPETTEKCRRESYFGDIPPDYLCSSALIIAIVVIIGLGIMVGCLLLSNRVKINDANKANAEAERFNAFTQEERAAIIQWEDFDDYDEETLLRPYHEVGHLYDPFPAPSEWNLVAIALVILAVISAIFSFVYMVSHSPRFYYYDLPSGVYGKILFFVMFISWPAMLVSFIKAKIRENADRRKTESAATTADSAPTESATAETSADASTNTDTSTVQPEQATPSHQDDDTYDPSPIVRTPLTVLSLQSAAQHYIEFATKEVAACHADERSQAIRDAEATVGRIEVQIKQLSNDIQQKQTDLGKAKASLQTARDLPEVSPEELLGDAEKDWRFVQHLQGVYGVYYDPDGKELQVYVRVSLFHEDSYYDAGDYKIVIKPRDADDYFDCTEVRCAIRPDIDIEHDDSAAYRYGESFCFGDRESEICDYIDELRFAEALSIIIDCLHWVNPHDRQYIPATFYPIDTDKDPIIDHYLESKEE